MTKAKDQNTLPSVYVAPLPSVEQLKEDPKPATGTPLIERILWVRRWVTRIPKNGYNVHGGYWYATEADLFEMVRGLMAYAGIHVSQELPAPYEGPTFYERTTSKGIKRTAEWNFIHVMTDGETVQQHMFPGWASFDSLGDKALYAASTNAIKYFFFRFFTVSSGEDVEAFGPEGNGDVLPAIDSKTQKELDRLQFIDNTLKNLKNDILKKLQIGKHSLTEYQGLANSEWASRGTILKMLAPALGSSVFDEIKKRTDSLKAKAATEPEPAPTFLEVIKKEFGEIPEELDNLQTLYNDAIERCGGAIIATGDLDKDLQESFPKLNYEQLETLQDYLSRYGV